MCISNHKADSFGSVAITYIFFIQSRTLHRSRLSPSFVSEDRSFSSLRFSPSCTRAHCCCNPCPCCQTLCSCWCSRASCYCCMCGLCCCGSQRNHGLNVDACVGEDVCGQPGQKEKIKRTCVSQSTANTLRHITKWLRISACSW